MEHGGFRAVTLHPGLTAEREGERERERGRIYSGKEPGDKGNETE